MTDLQTHAPARKKTTKRTRQTLENVKTHAPVRKKLSKEHEKHKKMLKPLRLCTKTKRKDARTEPRGYSHPEGPAIRTTVCMRPRSFASPARTARTKRKQRRNEADLPVTGVGQAGQAPLNLRYTPCPPPNPPPPTPSHPLSHPPTPPPSAKKKKKTKKKKQKKN